MLHLTPLAPPAMSDAGTGNTPHAGRAVAVNVLGTLGAVSVGQICSDVAR